MTHEPAHQPLDQTDPHHEGHHKHVIVRVSTLAAVLGALLLLTVLTVGQAQVEVYMNTHYGVVLPQIFNVAVVMTIAVIKASLVALYFMQLRWDSPLNAIVFLFCLSAVGLFLGFTMIDLGSRDAVDPIKAGEIQAGGLGISIPDKVNTDAKAIVVWARDARIELIAERAAQGLIDLHGLTAEQYYEQVEKPLFSHKAHAAHPEQVVSSPNLSRPPQPQGQALFSERSPAAGHGGGH